MKGIYVFLAEGFEISEALTTVNMLRRAGLDCPTVSIGEELLVTSSNGTTVMADMDWDSFKEDSALSTCAVEDSVMIFPGGMPGSANLASQNELMDMMRSHFAEGGTVAAICAAPSVVLGLLPDIKGRRLTCYDSFEDALIAKGAEYVKDGVVVDGNMITGRGPGWAVEFGLAIVEKLCGAQKAAAIKAQLML